MMHATILRVCKIAAGVMAVWCIGIGAGMSNTAAAADVPGSADHPLIPRYEGAEIVAYDTQAFTQRSFARAPIKQGGGLDKNPDAALRLEGKLTAITYRAPAERTSLEAIRNYQAALKDAGFTTVFNCSQADCGGRTFNHAMSPRNYYMGFGEYHADQQYVLARLQRPEGDVYAGIYTVLNKAGGGPDQNRALIQLDVLELTPMEQRMVTLSADKMNTDLAVDGRVALYGILFDLDKDTLRPDSRPQLDEIATLLTDNPNLKVLIVGHTDAQGDREYNRDLSLRRARSVIRALVDDYNIEASRLSPEGVGFAAPVASNRTEEGRAKNRRVELVDLGS